LLHDVGARFPTVTLSLPDVPLWTNGDPDALMRIVTNLLDNAVRHATSAVSLGAAAGSAIGPLAGRIVVTVTDDGPGIPAADRERVFERFARLDDARARDEGGAGLGLAIVRELVRRHGGYVRLLDATVRPVGSGPDAAPPGLRVEIDLPAAAPPSD